MIARMHHALATPPGLKFELAFALAACCLTSAAALADTPTRAVRLVVPSVPAGGTDLTWRMI